MKFKEILEKFHPTQKLKWHGGGDITGREYTVENLRKWNDQSEYSSVSGDLSFVQDGIKIFIIKQDIVLFSGILEFI